MAEAFIVATARTAGGRRGGQLAGWHPVDLAAQIIDALVARSGADPAAIDDVILGCVGQAGEQSSNIARNAALASCLPRIGARQPPSTGNVARRSRRFILRRRR